MNIDQEGKDKLARVCESETLGLLTPEPVSHSGCSITVLYF